jgi:pimeloyl-ACP methyl ester carboxylesterase
VSIAAGVPYIAVPPPGPVREAPMVAVWHQFGASEAAMAAALPLSDLPAWRIYFGLPGTGSRRSAPAPDRDLLLDWYAPLVEQAVAEFPAVHAELRRKLPIDDGPVAVVGGSAGGHVALLAMIGGQVPVAAAAVVNPAVRAESVIAVSSPGGYEWTAAKRAKAAAMDAVLLAGSVSPGTAVLLVSGEHEFPEFVPDQNALLGALPGPVRHVTVAGMGHNLTEPLQELPAAQTPAAAAVDRAVTAFLGAAIPAR